ncbi:MAG: hypothetical protein HC876_17055 [Chloroflexaceae bacterium]|nr:hypothetical protein [Chloroflexaceae bacterium]NJO07081.1 hypothetical protein [Chloroflexaceae bacterium]
MQSQRSGQEPAAPIRTTRPQQSPRSAAPIEPRFRAGDRIVCVPYGEGVVQSSRIVDEQELITVRFAEHGIIEVNPSVNSVRRIEQPSRPGDEEGGQHEIPW